jgi:hypothetical protein
MDAVVTTNKAAKSTQEIQKKLRGWRQAVRHCEIRIEMLERDYLADGDKEAALMELGVVREVLSLLRVEQS